MIKKEYSLWRIIQFCFYLIFTKFVCFKARIIRFPIFISGKKYINWGKGITIGVGCRLEVFKLQGHVNPILILGKDIQLNDYVHICSLEKVEIGDGTLLASHVYISDNSHGFYKGTSEDSSPQVDPINRSYYTSPVYIGKRVWIGEGVMVMPGVKIGDGAIIGAHSVVTTNIPDNTIAVGSPAKVIKKYNFSSKRWERVTNKY